MSVSSNHAAGGDPPASPYFHLSSPTESSQSSPSPISGLGMLSSPIPVIPQNQQERVPFRDCELGKMTMSVLAPATTILACMKVWTHSSPVAAIPLLFLCYGSLAIIVGVAMSRYFPSVARLIEEMGVILVFGSFTWAMSSMFYPSIYLMMIQILCFPILLVALVVLRYVDSNPRSHAGFGHQRCKCTTMI